MTMKRPLKTYFVIILSIFIFAFFIYSLEKKQSIKENTKDKLLLALESKVQVFDPRIIGTDANSQYIEELRFLPLISFDEYGNRVNRLAESITLKSKKSWIIKIKKGILFESGQEITADDVVATYRVIMNSPFGFPPSPRKGAFKDVVKFEKLSSNEIYVELKNPDASFLNNLGIGILPAIAANNALPNEVNHKGYESGPFVLTKFSTNEIILKKNSKYNLGSAPNINLIDFKIIPDAGTRYAALIKGDLDVIQNSLDPDKLETIKNNFANQFHIYTSTKLATTYLGFNFKDPLLKNLKVRQAIAYSIDVQSILKYRLHSDETQATSLFPPQNFYFNGSVDQLTYNPEKAKNLLKEVSKNNSLSISIKVSSSNKSTIEVAKAIAANLQTVGFHPRIETLENSIFQEQIRKGISQIWISPWTGFKDPDHLRFIFATDMVPPNGANRGNYSNLELDELLLQGQQEIVPNERKKIYDKAQQIISHDLPYVFLWHGQNFAVASNKIKGFKLYADGRYWSLIDVVKQQ